MDIVKEYHLVNLQGKSLPPSCMKHTIDEIQTLLAKVASAEVLCDLLERAQNGLRWYQDEHPNDASEADGELHIEIEEALSTYGKQNVDDILEKSLTHVKTQLANYKKLSEVK